MTWKTQLYRILQLTALMCAGAIILDLLIGGPRIGPSGVEQVLDEWTPLLVGAVLGTFLFYGFDSHPGSNKN